MSKPPRIPDSGNSLGPITAEFDSVSLLKGLLLIDDRSPAGAGHASVAEHGEADLPGASLTGEASNGALGADPIFETRVATAGDDVEEKGSGTISGNINDLELGYDGTTRQTVGIRFTGIDIPKGAIITSAYIQFQANEVKTGATSL